MTRAFVIDNFDSFTHNVVHGLIGAGAEVEVRRADRCTLDDVTAAKPDLLVISPGPGEPRAARLALAAVAQLGGRIPILGVCLGMQVMALAHGGKVVPGEPVHGKSWPVEHNGRGLFEGLPSPMTVGRYHSLHVTCVPDTFEVTAHTPEGVVMALRHRTLPMAAVQFHPDSFLTPLGGRIFAHALAGHF